MKTKLIIAGLVLGLIVIGGWFYAQTTISSGLERAEAAVEKGEFGRARILLERQTDWLMQSQQRWKADFLLARAIILDESLPLELSDEKAVPLLESIPAESEYYSQAQLSLGKRALLQVVQPRAAERMFLRAVEADSGNVEAWDMLFTLYCATHEVNQANWAFWQGFPLAPEDEKLMRFQQWFYSQFTRNFANQFIDQSLNVVDEKGEEFTIFNRLVLFKNQEPKEGSHFGSLADWWLNQDESKFAIKVLQEGKNSSGNLTHTKYLEALANSLIRQGAYDHASQTLESWPEATRNFYYYRSQGLVHQDQNQFAEACKFYEQAEKLWPGSSDMYLFYRMKECYEEIGQNEKADQAAARSTEITTWMQDRWPDIRAAMARLDDVESLETLIQFFKVVQHQQAVEFLQEQVEILKSNPVAGPEPAATNE